MNIEYQVITNKNPSHFRGDNLPVEQVSWFEANEFCRRLNQIANFNYRLPTDAEWEYACRAGTSSPFYCGENIVPNLGNYNTAYPHGMVSSQPSMQQTSPVGTYYPNAFGLFDMLGNIWELSQTLFQAPAPGLIYGVNLSAAAVTTPNTYLICGSSWACTAWMCRSAYRSCFTPEAVHNTVGFRVAANYSPV